MDEPMAGGGSYPLLADPQRYVLGIGCRRGVDLRELKDLAGLVLFQAEIDSQAISSIATVAGREGEPALVALSALFGCRLLGFPPSRLEQETPRLLNPSAATFARIGSHGVAEAAALAAAGPHARLVVGKTVSRQATAAIALCSPQGKD